MLMLTYFFIAIGVSFLCSILEAVLLSTTTAHIKTVKEKNHKLGSLMMHQKENIDFSIAAILTLNTFAHTLGAAGVGAEAVKVFGQDYMFYISAVLTLLILIFSEIIPKTLGAYYWKPLSKVCTIIIKYLVLITYPLLVVMNKLTDLIKPDEKKLTITKEEIAAAAMVAEENGILKEKETSFIENILNFENIRVKDIHTPRSVMFALSKKTLISSFEDPSILNYNKLKEYSRIPIYGENIDDIIGIVYSKEYFYECISNELDDKSKIIKSIYTINENIPISKLLDIFLSRKEQLFVVTDKYDQTVGVVSLEDVMETLLGTEIVDEQDRFENLRKVAKLKLKYFNKTKNS